MRLVPSRRLTKRDVSYEFMNRQMVWHAFTVRLFPFPAFSYSSYQLSVNRNSSFSCSPSSVLEQSVANSTALLACCHQYLHIHCYISADFWDSAPMSKECLAPRKNEANFGHSQKINAPYVLKMRNSISIYPNLPTSSLRWQQTHQLIRQSIQKRNLQHIQFIIHTKPLADTYIVITA